MKPVRFSVKAFLLGVAAVAAGFGALASDSDLVASLVFTLNLALLCIALVGAIVAAGQARVFWIGFVVFGGLYSLVAFGVLFPAQPNYGYMNVSPWMAYPRATERPQLITSRLLEVFASMRGPSRSIGDKVSALWSGGGFYPATITAYKDGRYEVRWDDGSRPEWVTAGQMQPLGRDLDRVGHAVFSLLFGFLGGLAAVCCLSPRNMNADGLPAKPRSG